MYLRDTIVVDMRLLGCGDILRAYRLYRVYHTCGALSREFFYRLAVGLYPMFFIRKLRLALVVYSGFTRGEYHIVCVDFICSLRGHQRTKEKDSAEPLSSILWTPPPHPGGIRCGGAYLLTRAYRDIGFRYPVQVAYPQFRILFGCLCSALYRSRFSWVVGRVSFVFHYWGIGCSCLRLRGVLLWSIVGFALTAIGAFVWVETVRDKLYR